MENTSFEIFLTFNFVDGFSRVISATETEFLSTGTSTANYPGWKLDKTARFLFCTDASGKTVASCSIQSFGMEDQYRVQISRERYEFLGGIDRNIFKMLERIIVG